MSGVSIDKLPLQKPLLRTTPKPMKSGLAGADPGPGASATSAASKETGAPGS